MNSYVSNTSYMSYGSHDRMSFAWKYRQSLNRFKLMTRG
jgi:hypothetical protein